MTTRLRIYKEGCPDLAVSRHLGVTIAQVGDCALWVPGSRANLLVSRLGAPRGAVYYVSCEELTLGESGRAEHRLSHLPGKIRGLL